MTYLPTWVLRAHARWRGYSWFGREAYLTDRAIRAEARRPPPGCCPVTASMDLFYCRRVAGHSGKHSPHPLPGGVLIAPWGEP